ASSPPSLPRLCPEGRSTPFWPSTTLRPRRSRSDTRTVRLARPPTIGASLSLVNFAPCSPHPVPRRIPMPSEAEAARAKFIELWPGVSPSIAMMEEVLSAASAVRSEGADDRSLALCLETYGLDYMQRA